MDRLLFIVAYVLFSIINYYSHNDFNAGKDRSANGNGQIRNILTAILEQRIDISR